MIIFLSMFPFALSALPTYACEECNSTNEMVPIVVEEKVALDAAEEYINQLQDIENH